jgi:AcrR family transcriptional regulator
MARPFTASDDEILSAARKVLSSRGPDAFSMAEVANEVGLSRAAIILRFKSTHALKVASLQKMVQQFEALMETLPATPGGDNLLRVAAFIGGHIRSRESSVRFFANFFGTNIPDRELLELEHRRGAALDQAIARVMPETVLERDSAVLAFRSHLSGSIMAWLSLDHPDSRRYVVMRTIEWLKLARIPFSEQVAQEVSAPSMQGEHAAPAAAKSRPSKIARAAKRKRPRSKSAAARR